MKVVYFFYIVFLTLTLVACKKEVITATTPSIAPPKLKEFESCTCNGKGETGGEGGEYIKADLDGVPLCFDQLPNVGDTFPNMLKHGFIIRTTGNQYYDNLYMIRNGKNSKWQAAIFLENTHALTKTYPYQLPRPNPEVCEIGELQLNDLYNYTSCAWCSENTFNYFASFWSTGVKMEVTSFNNNFFEGVFSGIIRTGSGKMVDVTNGKFRIKLKVFQRNIVIP